MTNYTTMNIVETIEIAILKAEAELKKAKISLECAEIETDETMTQVLYYENRIIVDDTLETAVQLDKAYADHDKEMKAYYNADEDVKHLTKAIELLREAQSVMQL